MSSHLCLKGKTRNNKDAIVTFLHKWQALHQLRRTPDVNTPVQASLSLEGRAYKWWMSLPDEGRPKSWAKFEVVFKKISFQKTKRIVIGMLGINVVWIMLRWLNIFPNIVS